MPSTPAYPPKPLFFKRSAPESMSGRSQAGYERFILRLVKRERSGYFLPYALCICFGWAGVHRLYLRQYRWALGVFLGCLFLSVLMVSGTLIRGIAAALLMCVLIFEAASLWWFVRRFNRMNEAQIRRVYAASIF